MTDICLIFPPLMNTGFGNVYPSGAVLAGYMHAHGVSTLQLDLNEELAQYVLEDERLSEAAAGRFFSGPQNPREEDPASVAARLLKKNRALLFDDQGRHKFNDKTGPGHLLKALSQPFHVDAPIAELVDIETHFPALAEWYDTFYESCDVISKLDAAKHLVGITVAMGPQIGPAIVLARHIKRHRRDLRVVLGGPTISLMQDPALKHFLSGVPEVDAAVRFDGEVPLLSLLKQSRRQAWRPSDAPGVLALVDDELVGAPQAAAPRLSKLPAPHYCNDLLSRLAAPELGLVVTRGCYWGRCVYCDFVELYGDNPAYRTRRVRDFVDEAADLLAAHGCDTFTLITEALPPSFARKFAEELIESRLKIRWNSFAMVDDRFVRDTFSLMAHSGCQYLVIGVETMNDRVLKLVKKAATREKNLNFLKTAAHEGIGLFVNIIPDLPTTTFDEAMEDLKIFQSIEDILTSVAIFPFEATQSSEIGRNPGSYGLRVDEVGACGGQAEYAGNHLVTTDIAMTDEERRDVINAFTEFAERINAQARDTTTEAWDCGHDREACIDAGPRKPHYRVALEDFDIVSSNGEARAYNWRRRAAWSMQPGYRVLLDRIGTQPFTMDRLIELAQDPDVARTIHNDLLQLGFIKRASP